MEIHQNPPPIFQKKYPDPETNIFALKIGRAPKGKDRLPTTNFWGYASFREGTLID